MTSAEADVGWREIGDTLMLSQVIVIAKDVADFLFEITGQIIVLGQDAVLAGLMPALMLPVSRGIAWMMVASH